MLSIKRILCPTDFSEFSIAALEVAGEWAQHFGAELYTVHVLEPLTPQMLEPISGRISAESFEVAREAEAAWQLQEAASGRVPHGVTMHPLVKCGYPAEVITVTATALQADFVVIATHGIRNWRDFVSGKAVKKIILGSVSQNVIRTATCPVLTVRPNEMHGQPQNVAHKAAGLTVMAT